MLDTSARLLRLLALLQSRRFWTGAELASALDVTERTVRRDVDKLRSLGYPVDATPGVAGGYQLGAGAKMPPLLLDDDEALAVVVGLGSATTGAIAGIEESAVRALAKLMAVLPQRLRRRVTALRDAVVPMHARGPSVEPAHLTTLTEASRDHECVRFAYEDREGKASSRDVEPLGLVHSGALWYLVAWDRMREDFRTFRVDRMRGHIERGVRFAPRALPERDLAAYVSRSVSTGPYAYSVRVVLYAPAEIASRMVGPLAGRVTKVDEARCLLETGGASLEKIALYIGAMGFDFEVESPDALVEHVAGLASRFGRASGRT